MIIDRERDALIIVDLQPDFMAGGALEVPGAHEIAGPIFEFARRFDVVVATQDWHPADHLSFASTHGKKPFEQIELHGKPQVLWPDHCVQGTVGAQLALSADCDRRVGLVIRKGMNREIDSYSAFRENWGPNGKRLETGLLGFLHVRRVRRVYVVGLALDYCVKWTAIDAAMAMEPRVMLSMTRAVDPNGAFASIAEMKAEGVQVLE